jgi:cytochrome P450 family 2 subfamily AA/AD
MHTHATFVVSGIYATLSTQSRNFFISKDVGKPMNLNLKMNLPIVNALWYILVGEHFELEDPKLAAIVTQFDKALRLESRPSLLDKFMILTSAKLTKIFNKDFKTFMKLFSDIGSLVKTHITEHKKSLDPDQPRDFMDSFLIEVAKTKDSKSSFFGQRGEESLISTLTDLFLAGKESFIITARLFQSFFFLFRD